MEVSGQSHAPVDLHPRKELAVPRYTLQGKGE